MSDTLCVPADNPCEHEAPEAMHAISNAQQKNRELCHKAPGPAVPLTAAVPKSAVVSTPAASKTAASAQPTVPPLSPVPSAASARDVLKRSTKENHSPDKSTGSFQIIGDLQHR